VEPDRVLQAVSLFGARVRGHGSDFDTPELHAWLQAAAADEPLPGAAEPPWRSRARAVERRLPAPARRAARGTARRLIGRART
jgi:hypothetical protein